MSGTLNGFCKQALMCRADSADSPGQYLSPFGDKMTKKLCILKINIRNFLGAELANSLAPNTEPSLTCHSFQPFYRSIRDPFLK
jgi:hypothetical protein